MAKNKMISSILKKLLFERDIKAADLARAVGLPPPTIHRLVTGKSTRPYASSLQPIADYFGITVEQLKGEAPLTSAASFSSLPANQTRTIEIPLIAWSNLLAIGDAQADKTIVVLNDLSDKCFAIMMNDSSMGLQFAEGSVLILDPNKEPKDRSYVLVWLSKKDICVFRQLLIDADNKFLKPLHPDLTAFEMRLLDAKDKIIGTLVEARQEFDH